MEVNEAIKTPTFWELGPQKQRKVLISWILVLQKCPVLVLPIFMDISQFLGANHDLESNSTGFAPLFSQSREIFPIVYRLGRVLGQKLAFCFVYIVFQCPVVKVMGTSVYKRPTLCFKGIFNMVLETLKPLGPRL